MRTTLEIDDDVLTAAQELAQRDEQQHRPRPHEARSGPTTSNPIGPASIAIVMKRR